VRVGDIAQSLNTLVAGQKVSTFNAGTINTRAGGARWESFPRSADG